MSGSRSRCTPSEDASAEPRNCGTRGRERCSLSIGGRRSSLWSAYLAAAADLIDLIDEDDTVLLDEVHRLTLDVVLRDASPRASTRVGMERGRAARVQ